MKTRIGASRDGIILPIHQSKDFWFDIYRRALANLFLMVISTQILTLQKMRLWVYIKRKRGRFRKMSGGKKEERRQDRSSCKCVYSRFPLRSKVQSKQLFTGNDGWDYFVKSFLVSLFADLRYELLDPNENGDLVRALYGLLNLMPQTTQFRVLNSRLSNLPKNPLNQPPR